MSLCNCQLLSKKIMRVPCNSLCSNCMNYTTMHETCLKPASEVDNAITNMFRRNMFPWNQFTLIMFRLSSERSFRSSCLVPEITNAASSLTIKCKLEDWSCKYSRHLRTGIVINWFARFSLATPKRFCEKMKMESFWFFRLWWAYDSACRAKVAWALDSAFLGSSSV